MPLEGAVEIISDESKGVFDPEKIWGGDESEWANWRQAERNMTLEEYNVEQVKEMTGEKTKEAFRKVYGSTVNDPSPILLANFFIDRAGSEYFKRRFFQKRSDINPEIIEDYYLNHRWEEELAEHAAKQGKNL